MSDPTEPASDPPPIVALRTIGAVLIELPFAVEPIEQPWAASIWPAPGGGWGRELWTYDPRRRGWIIPSSCHHGTIVEARDRDPAPPTHRHRPGLVRGGRHPRPALAGLRLPDQ
ncbi:MAG: hypothetical protein QM733_04410 [Ilumatobacteraceae bacterium]